MWNITLLCLCCPVLLFYSRARIQVEPLDGFSRLMAQTTHFHPWMCYLGVRIIRVKFWGKSPQNSPKWAWLGILHAKWENTKIAIYPKVIKIPKSNLNSNLIIRFWRNLVCRRRFSLCPLMFIQNLIFSKFKMADGSYLENIRNVVTSRKIDWFARNLVCGRIWSS